MSKAYGKFAKDFELSDNEIRVIDADRVIYGDGHEQAIERVDRRITFGGLFKVTPTGLQVNGVPTETDWRDLLTYLFAIEDRLNLAIGDVLVFMEREYGVTYEQVASRYNRKVKTLRNWVWVCTHVETSLRQDNLYMGHYNLVAGFSDPKRKLKFLKEASDKNWSVARLRQEIGSSADEEIPASPLAQPRIKRRFDRVFRDLRLRGTTRIDAVDELIDWLHHVRKDLGS